MTGVNIGNVGTGATVVTVDGRYLIGIITPVVPGIGITSHVGTVVGTLVNGMITGLGGNVGTTMYDVVGSDTGILFIVTITVVCYNVYGIVGTKAIYVVGTWIGASYVGIITTDGDPGIVTIDVVGT